MEGESYLAMASALGMAQRRSIYEDRAVYVVPSDDGLRPYLVTTAPGKGVTYYAMFDSGYFVNVPEGKRELS